MRHQHAKLQEHNDELKRENKLKSHEPENSGLKGIKELEQITQYNDSLVHEVQQLKKEVIVISIE